MSTSFVASLVMLLNAARAVRAVGIGHACDITVQPFGVALPSSRA